jgi:hypothetical protein
MLHLAKELRYCLEDEVAVLSRAIMVNTSGACFKILFLQPAVLPVIDEKKNTSVE